MKERLKLIRKSLKKTQEQFANLCGKSRTAYNKYEAGAVIPDDSFIQLICIKFDVNEKWLRTGKGKMFTESKQGLLERLAEKYNLDKYDVSIVRHYIELSSNDRKKFTSLMKVVFSSSSDDEVPSDEASTIDDRMKVIRGELESAEKGQYLQLPLVQISRKKEIKTHKVSR